MSSFEEVDFDKLCLDGELFIKYMTNFNFKENIGFDNLFNHLMPLASENYVAVSKIFRKLTMNPDLHRYLTNTDQLLHYLQSAPEEPTPDITEMQIGIYLNVLENSDEPDIILSNEYHYHYFEKYILSEDISISDLLLILLYLVKPPNYVPVIKSFEMYERFMDNIWDNYPFLLPMYKLISRLITKQGNMKIFPSQLIKNILEHSKDNCFYKKQKDIFSVIMPLLIKFAKRKDVNKEFSSLFESILNQLLESKNQSTSIYFIDLLLATNAIKSNINEIVVSDFIYKIPSLFRPLMEIEKYCGLFKLLSELTENELFLSRFFSLNILPLVMMIIYNTNNEYILIQGLIIMKNLCNGGMDDTRSVFLLGGQQIITKCLKSNNPQLIINSLRAFVYFYYYFYNDSQIDLNGFLYLIINVLSKNIKNYQIVYWGSMLLWTYIEKNPTSISDIINNRGCDYVIHIMKLYIVDKKLIEVEIGLLSCISLRDTSSSVIADNIDLLIAILKQYPNNEKIQQYGLEIMANICTMPDILNELYAKRIDLIINGNVALFPNNKSIQHVASIALGYLESLDPNIKKTTSVNLPPLNANRTKPKEKDDCLIM